MLTALIILAWLGIPATLLAWHLDNRRQAALLRDVLDRISTESRLEMAPAPRALTPEPSTRKYIADHMADDAAWNEYRGDPVEADEE